MGFGTKRFRPAGKLKISPGGLPGCDGNLFNEGLDGYMRRDAISKAEYKTFLRGKIRARSLAV